jgi:hypothetical protein
VNRRQRDQNRENALRLSVVVTEHAEHPIYPNYVLAEAENIALANALTDNATLTV